MITPNKVVPLSESALAKSKYILECGPDDIELMNLFYKVESQFESIDQFLITLDLLFVLNQIDIDFPTRTVSYAH